MATDSCIAAWKISCQMSLWGYSPWGLKELEIPECAHTHTHTHTHIHCHLYKFEDQKTDFHIYSHIHHFLQSTSYNRFAIKSIWAVFLKILHFLVQEFAFAIFSKFPSLSWNTQSLTCYPALKSLSPNSLTPNSGSSKKSVNCFLLII